MSASSSTELFKEHTLIENYLRGTKLIKIIEEKTEEFVKTYAASRDPEVARAAIVLELPLQFKELLASSEDLLDFVIEEPIQFPEDAKYVIYSVVSSIIRESADPKPPYIDINQVHTFFRFFGLPVQEDLLYSPTLHQYRLGLSYAVGVLSAYTEPLTYVIQTVWFCATPTCDSHRIKTEDAKAPTCFSCSQPMEENSKLRRMGSFRYIKIFPFESVSTPRIFEKIFRCQLIRLRGTPRIRLRIDFGSKVHYHWQFRFGNPRIRSMESNEAVNSGISAIKSISDDDLDQLLEFNDDLDISEFLHHQPINDPLHTADLFPDNDESSVPADKTRKYPEFNLSFSFEPSEELFCLNTQKEPAVDLTDCTQKSKHEESIFVHPQVKDEPLDLSLQTPFCMPSTSKQFRREVDEANATSNNFNLDFSACIPGTSKEEPNSSVSKEMDSSEAGPSYARLSPMEFLTLSYSQHSLSETENNPVTNTPKDIQSSDTGQQEDTTGIPCSLLRLYETIKRSYSDFAFVYSLGSQMCQNEVPMDCFVHLKIGLLLSIASLEENRHRPPISVVAIGPEFAIATKIMENLGEVAERFVGPDDDFVVPANKKGQPIWVEAEPIVMARGGIFYLGDWDRLKKLRAAKFLKAVETGSVMLQRTNIVVPLESAVWTHWRSYNCNNKDQHTFNKFVEIFGIPLIIEEENHEVLVDFMLERASVRDYKPPVDELSIGPDDMRKFLSVVTKRQVDFTHEASEILRKYFVSVRMDRPECLSRKSYITLKLFAESFAKLSLRHEVIEIDAVAAVYMTENYIQNIFGPGVLPPPTFKLHSYIGDVDKHMMEFKEWLNNYFIRFHDSDEKMEASSSTIYL